MRTSRSALGFGAEADAFLRWLARIWGISHDQLPAYRSLPICVLMVVLWRQRFPGSVYYFPAAPFASVYS